MGSRRRWAKTAIGGLAVVLAVGCGDDGSGSTSDSTTSQTGSESGTGATSADPSTTGAPTTTTGTSTSTTATGTGTSSDTSGDSTGPGSGVYQEIEGILAVEAEHFETNEDLGTPRAWYLTTPRMDPGIDPDPDPPHADSASGMANLEALPDTRVTDQDPIMEGESIFNNVGTGPTLTYRVWFDTTGTYVVWVRAYSTGGEDNGIHVGIDGQWPTTGERIQFCTGKNMWWWSSAQRDSDGPCGINGTITIDVTEPGEHTIQFSMREDGFEFDKWVMALDPEFEPQDAGPEESPSMP